MTYVQPITLYAIIREISGTQNTEIATNEDKSLKIYEAEQDARTAIQLMPKDMGWRWAEILLVPPPRTEEYRRSQIKHEIDQALGMRHPGQDYEVTRVLPKLTKR